MHVPQSSVMLVPLIMPLYAWEPLGILLGVILIRLDYDAFFPMTTVFEVLRCLNQFNGWSRLIYLVLIGSKKTFHSHGLSGPNSRTERHPCVLDQSSGGVRSRAESQQWFQVIDLQKLHSHVAVRVREKTIPDRASRPRKACCSFLQAYRVNYSVPF